MNDNFWNPHVRQADHGFIFVIYIVLDNVLSQRIYMDRNTDLVMIMERVMFIILSIVTSFCAKIMHLNKTSFFGDYWGRLRCQLVEKVWSSDSSNNINCPFLSSLCKRCHQVQQYSLEWYLWVQQTWHLVSLNQVKESLEWEHMRILRLPEWPWFVLGQHDSLDVLLYIVEQKKIILLDEILLRDAGDMRWSKSVCNIWSPVMV